LLKRVRRLEPQDTKGLRIPLDDDLSNLIKPKFAESLKKKRIRTLSDVRRKGIRNRVGIDAIATSEEIDQLEGFRAATEALQDRATTDCRTTQGEAASTATG
jgi:hypothetical protein